MEMQSIQLILNGRKRKEAADCIGTALGAKPEYQKAPSYAYMIGTAVIDRNGNLSFDKSTKEKTRHTVLAALQAAGFLPELAEEPKAVPIHHEAPECLTIQIPKANFTDTALANLEKLVTSKATLLKKAVDTSTLPVVISKKTIDFPWFKSNATPERFQDFCARMRCRKQVQ